MANLEQTLQRLGLSFTVKDIMVPRAALTCASDPADAQRVSTQHPDYNVIPIQEHGKLTSFYERDSKCTKVISADVLIEAATSVVDVVEVLRQRAFCFVLVRNEIEGYVHFSDLNNPLVKLAFYAIFEAFERHLLSELGLVSEGELAEVLRPKRLKRIKKEMRRAKKNEANLSWENFLFLPEILRLGRHRGKVMLKDEEINAVKTFRNRVSHAGWMLVEDRDDLGRLVEAKRICLALLTGTAGGD